MKSDSALHLIPDRVRRISDFLAGALLRSPRWAFNLTLFVVGTALSAYLTHKLFQALPHLDDSVAALYQARIFQQGKLTWPVDPSIKPFFDIFGVITPIGKPDSWAGMYPPGWPLLLTVGLLFKAPWLVNPVLGGLLIVSISELARELYDEKTARVAGTMALASPFLAVISATHLSHTSAALSCTFSWWCALRLLRSGRIRYALGAGAAMGMTLLTRPEVAVCLGGVIVVGVLVQFRRVIVIWRQLALAAFITMLGGIALLGFQHIAVGKAGTTGHSVEMQEDLGLGFGRVGRTSWVHTPERALSLSGMRLKELNRRLLGWPIPAAVLVLAPFFLLRAGLRELWLLAPLLTLLGFFALYFYWEEWLPGRYLFPAIPMLLLLSARGWSVWTERLRRIRFVSGIPKWLLLVGTAYALGVAAPKYHMFFGPHHGDVESWLPRVVEAHGVSNALVFMRSTGRVRKSVGTNDFYATGFMRNTLNLDGDIVFARHGGEKGVGLANELLIERYPGRSYYYYKFDQSRMRPHLYRLNVENGRIHSRVRLKHRRNSPGLS